MKKIIFALSLICAASSQAAYLYWQLDSAATSAFEYNTASIGYASGGTTYYLDTVSRSQASDGVISTSLDSLEDGVEYSLFIELSNYNTSDQSYAVKAYSETLTYSTINPTTYVDTSLTPTMPATVWHGGTFTAPEPTSGILIMLGLSALALKRRKA